MLGSAGANPTSAARDRWLARQPDPTVVAGVREQRWLGLIQWKLGHAAEALGNLSTLADRLTMRDGFTTLWMRPHEPWDLTKSRVLTSAYSELMVVQQSCRRREKQEFAPIAAIMRDLIVLAAIAGAGTHSSADLFKENVVLAFGGEPDKDLHAQLMHSYHHLMNHVPGAFESGVSKDRRLRRARVRQRDDESASDGGNVGMREASRQLGSADSRQHLGGAVDQPMRVRAPEPDVPGLADLRKFIEADSIRLWKALQHEQVERARLGDELCKMRQELEQEQAEVSRLTAKLDPGARTSALFGDTSATLEELEGFPECLSFLLSPSSALPLPSLLLLLLLLLLFRLPPPPLSSSFPPSIRSLPPSFLLLLGSPTAPGETVQEGPDADAAAGSCRSRGGAVGEGLAADGQPRCGVAEGAGGLGDADGAPISRVCQLEQELAEERRQRQLTAVKLAAALEQLAAALQAAAAAGSAAGVPSAEDEVLVLPIFRAAAPRSNAAVGGGAPAAASGGLCEIASSGLVETSASMLFGIVVLLYRARMFMACHFATSIW